jgi:hypothetical protein
VSGKSLADYAAEALRTPFVLPVGDGTDITIAPPTVEQVLAVEEAQTEREALKIVAGDAYEALSAALAAQPAGVFGALLTDMRKHFGLGN